MSYCIVQRSRPKFITYDHRGTLVFVTPASNYEQALDIAQKEFPKLAKVPRDRIIFNLFVLNRETNSRQSIRISPEAWTATIDKASPGQVVSIDTLPTRKFWNFGRAKSEERAPSPDEIVQKDGESSLSSSTRG